MDTTGTADAGARLDLTDDAKRLPDEVTDETQPVSSRQFQDLFDRWADSFALRIPDLFGNRLTELWGAGRELGGVIRIEESVDDDGVTLRAEIPGVDPEDDVEITVDNGRLLISAERRSEKKEEEEGRVRSEFRYGSYRRSLQLPSGAATDEITATCDNGILEVRIPVESAKKTGTAKIPITKSI